MKIILAFVAALTLATSAFAQQHPSIYYGNVAMVDTDIPLTSTVASYTNAVRLIATSGFSTNAANQSPANQLLRLSLNFINTNSANVNLYSTSATNLNSFVATIQSNGGTYELKYPIIDGNEYYGAIPSNTAGFIAGTIGGTERWGHIQ